MHRCHSALALTHPTATNKSYLAIAEASVIKVANLWVAICLIAVGCGPGVNSSAATRADPTPGPTTAPGPSVSVPTPSSQASEPTTESISPRPPAPTVAPTATAVPTVDPSPRPGRTGLSAYNGLGAWVDVFDWAPAYGGAEGPAVKPSDVSEMAAQGVTTLFFQTSRLDDTSQGRIESPAAVAEFLAAAHQVDISVVGWYLPKWEDAAEDLARLVAIADFDREGQRFDGIAVDIEGVPEVAQRADWNQRLVALSSELRASVGEVAIGAIVLPPTLLEVVNTEYWPDFPWADLAPIYDAWLPMSYWSFRDDDSPFANGYSYNFDATQRLRANIGDPSAIVHGIGGIGASVGSSEGAEPLAAVDDIDDFVRSLGDSGSVGGSIYDWASQDESGRQAMTEAMAAAGLTE